MWHQRCAALALRLLGQRIWVRRGQKNHRCTFWNIGKLIYKDGAAGAQAFNYRSVVYDFMAYVNRSAVDGERSLNDGNGAGNAGAKAARLRKKNLHVVKAWVCWVWE